MMMSVGPLHFVFVLGCTGCGKGAVARALAEHVDAEILSVDSMKVYRRMDIGTAKPSREARSTARHHLIDVVEPSEEFSLARYLVSAESAAADIVSRGKTVLAVGGTAMYIKGLSEGIFEGPSADPALRERLHRRAEADGLDALHGDLVCVDPEAAERIHRNDLRRMVRALEVHELTGTPITALQTQWDRQRTKHRCTFIGLRRDLAEQNHRTNTRVKRLIELGWIDEVKSLLAESPPLGSTARQATGYRELIEHVSGNLALEDAVEMIKISTRRLAKAQRTWFKRFRETAWFDVAAEETAAQVASRVFDRWNELCCT